MRYPAAYYLLLLYCTVLMRCAIPVACDALSHICNEEEHLATIHAVYGNNHLQAEVAGTVSDNHSCKHTAQQQDEPNSVHTLTKNSACHPAYMFVIASYFTSHFHLPADVLPAGIHQPPKQA